MNDLQLTDPQPIRPSWLFRTFCLFAGIGGILLTLGGLIGFFATLGDGETPLHCMNAFFAGMFVLAGVGHIRRSETEARPAHPTGAEDSSSMASSQGQQQASRPRTMRAFVIGSLLTAIVAGGVGWYQYRQHQREQRSLEAAIRLISQRQQEQEQEAARLRRETASLKSRLRHAEARVATRGTAPTLVFPGRPLLPGQPAIINAFRATREPLGKGGMSDAQRRAFLFREFGMKPDQLVPPNKHP